MNALVSIITPSFNSAKFIAETIQSVQNQTYQNWEMIIVDDGSSDETVTIIKKIVINESRIKLIELDKNNGSGFARDKALEHANGNYIAFLDSDDLWKPNKLEKQLQFMKEFKLPLTFSFYELIDEESLPLNKVITTPNNITYNKLYYCNWVGNLTGIYSVDFFGKVPISFVKKRQDWMLWLTLVKKTGKIIPMPENLASYRIRKDSISASKWRLIKYNFMVYKNYHKQNTFKAFIDLLHFFFNQLIVKPKYKI
jgi:glycosyltransferase involved in cell wall biosynthesis